MLALALRPKGEVQEFIFYAWKRINNFHNIKFIAENSASPHMTLIAGIDETFENDLNSLLIRLKNNWTSFEIFTKGLGILLLDQPLIYLRWKNSIEINKLRKELLYELKINNILQKELDYNKDWLAKTTIFYFDTKYDEALIEIIKFIRSSYKYDMKSVINDLIIIKYNEEAKEQAILKYEFKN